MLLPPWWLWPTSEHTYWHLGMTLVGYGIGLQFLESSMPAGDDCRRREGCLVMVLAPEDFSKAQPWVGGVL